MTGRPGVRWGAWPSPVTSELVVRAANLPNGIHLDGDDLWWSEGRPEEGGRTAVLRRAADGTVTEVLPGPWSARSAVHEYGGGAWWVRDGVLWFVDWASQRVHRAEPGGEPVPLTPEPATPRSVRYADGAPAPDGSSLLVVREEHGADGVHNTVVRLAAHEPSTPAVVVAGPDFVSDPRWRLDGGAFCWLEWDQPAMPWDRTRLVVDEGGRRAVVAGAGGDESICQPTWAADGALWFASDRTGFWSLYRWTPADGVELVVDLGHDIGFPQWVFGQSCFVLLDDGRVVLAYQAEGTDHLAVRHVDGRVEAHDVGITSAEWLRTNGRDVALVAASPTAEQHVARLHVPATGAARLEVVVPPRDLGLGPAWFARPEPVDFETTGGMTAHALLYRPTNPEVVPPEGARPPLLVMIHGGPTAAARPLLRLATQFWTTRGFAVVDVNYRGSTGYGRAYRRLLDGQWGVADVEDCVAVARHLADAGVVDGDRMFIRGGSAGGFTTLAALAFHDVFAGGASHYGVADLGLLAAETHKFEARYLDGLVGPWPEARHVYDARSPINQLDGIDRPLAVFQGLDDAVVPPRQAELIVEGLRARGVPVTYVAFEGEGHGFRKAENIRTALDTELAFYQALLDQDRPAP